MKQRQRPGQLISFVFLLACVLCAAGCASKQEPVALVIPGDIYPEEFNLDNAEYWSGLCNALPKAAGLDQQLALLYKASVDHTELFETGGWQVDLNRALAAGGKEWIPAKEAYEGAQVADSLPEQFKNKKLIALYDDSGSIRLAGNLYVRLPETMRAQNKKEADGVLILRQYATQRTDYIGNAYNLHYALYARLFDSDILYRLFYDYTTPPASGYGDLYGKEIPARLLWGRMQHLFFDRILTMETAEGPLYFGVTGRGCSLYKAEGDREVLDIPSSVEGCPVTGISLSKLYAACPSLREARLPEGLVTVGEGAFLYCRQLHTVNFPSTLRNISERAFDSAPLEEIILNEGLETIGDSAFTGSSALRSVTLPSTVKAYRRGFLADGGFFPYLVIPEGVVRLGDRFMQNANHTLCVYIPQTVTIFGRELLAGGRIRIYTPEGSPAARWAEKSGYACTPCPGAEAMPRPAFVTEGDFEYAVLEGEAILIRYLGSGKHVPVPSELGGCPVKRIKSHAFDQCDSVTFPGCLAELESMAIYDCDGIQVFIPGSQTALDHDAILFSGGAVIYAPKDSLAHQYCLDNKHEWVEWEPER